MVEICLEHGRNIPRALSKHTSSTVETCLEHGRNISRARSKHTSSTVETFLEHSRNLPRARSKYIASTVETHQITPITTYLIFSSHETIRHNSPKIDITTPLSIYFTLVQLPRSFFPQNLNGIPNVIPLNWK